MKYAEAYDVAAIALYNREAYGFKYKPGVAREAALAAVSAVSVEQAISAICRAFESMRCDINPLWDGSIA